MKKISFSYEKRIGISALLCICMILFSLVLVSTFEDVYTNPISNSTNPISNSTNPISNSTSPTTNLTSEGDNQNGTIASFPGSIDSDPRHLPV